MATTVGIRDLQQNASKVVARATAGEEIEITDRGRPVARIVPLRGSALDALVDSGRLRPARTDLVDLPPLVEVPPGELTASEILADLRADER